MSTWKKLSAINVSNHIEKKGQLSYLSWVWAWGTLMEHYPDSTYEFSPPMWLENKTVEVQVTVTVEGVARTMWLPVMDNRNKSIVDPTTRDISDARMRALVKAISMHGLGSYIYGGEDLPEAEAMAIVTVDQAAFIKSLLEATSSDVEKFCAHFQCSTVDQMKAQWYDRAVAVLEAKLAKK